MPCRNLQGVVINVPFKSQSIISKPKELYKGKVFKKKLNVSHGKVPAFFLKLLVCLKKKERFWSSLKVQGKGEAKKGNLTSTVLLVTQNQDSMLKRLGREFCRNYLPVSSLKRKPPNF